MYENNTGIYFPFHYAINTPVLKNHFSFKE